MTSKSGINTAFSEPAAPSDQERLKLALGSMKNVVMPVESADVLEDRRARIVRAIEQGFRQAPARRRRVVGLRWLYRAGLGIAAAAALTLGFERVSSSVQGARAPVAMPEPSARLSVLLGAAFVRAGADAQRIEGGERNIGEGAELSTTPDARAELILSEGARVTLGGASELRLHKARRLDEELELRLGHIELEVPRLGGQVRQLVVRTPSAAIWVTGTSFSVDVVRGATAHQFVTTVSVSRGAVRVVKGDHSEARLGAGESWSSGGSELAREVAKPEPAAPATLQKVDAPQIQREVRRRAGEAPSPSLARENSLFLAALSARNGGSDAQALKLYEQFLARYPRSELAQEVKVERFRALKRLGREAEARRGAREYLAGHEGGVARDEARELALPPRDDK